MSSRSGRALRARRREEAKRSWEQKFLSAQMLPMFDDDEF